MALVGQIRDEIDALPQEARNEDNTRYVELRSELQLLLLQAELKRLRVENETLQALVDNASAPGSDAPPASIRLIQRRLTELQRGQESFNEQLQIIAEQHATILEGAPDAAAATHSMSMQSHIVEVGDTLSYIAETYYSTADR